jgi:hypothetical protein
LQHAINDHNTLSQKHDRVLENIVCQGIELIQLKAQCTKLQDQIKNLHIWVSYLENISILLQAQNEVEVQCLH